jgi:BirA family biotin operon repressor/biotin-[acetyl-CoA-carboxylase] ligase
MTPQAAELVLDQLVEHDGAEAPAEELAHKLGLSPPEMYEAIESLRHSGYEIGYIDRADHHGIVLLQIPVRPLEATLRRRSAGHSIGRDLVFREEVGSTNTLARELAEADAEHGTAVVAHRQTGGRGRRGRTWLSLPGEHVFLSVVLRPGLPTERIFELTLVAAVALAEALESCGVLAGIKWPNDIEVDGRKIAGILCESAIDSQGVLRYAIVGVGVNVDTRAEEFPEELRGQATSVRAVTGREGLTAAVIASFLDRLEDWLVLHSSLGFESVLETWRGRTTTINAEVRALVDGRVITGVAEDVDASGALLVRDEHGQVERIIAGEVTTLRRL